MDDRCTRHDYGPTRELRVDAETETTPAMVWFGRGCRICGERDEWSVPDGTLLAVATRLPIVAMDLFTTVAEVLRIDRLAAWLAQKIDRSAR